MINHTELRNKLNRVSIDQIAHETNFSQRNDGKISPFNFLLSFILSIQKNNHSLRSWASELAILIRSTLSYNGMKNSQNENRAKFAKRLLQKVIKEQVEKQSNRSVLSVPTQLLEKFGSVYLEDSTCINLPSYLHKFFPGAFSTTGKAATAKIQLRQELKTGAYANLELQNFRDNDQKFAPNILGTLQSNDLVIRDLGYWVLAVFRQIIAIKAFFISRLRFGVNLYDCQTDQKIDLPKLLRKSRRNGQLIMDIELKVGKKAQLKTRVVAIKCPGNVTRKKRNAARKNRSAKANHSKDYFELLGWTLLFTNVPKEVLSAKQLLQIYGYRWRIEIIFKCWKSHFKIDQLFNGHTKLTKEQVEITFYLFLVWLTLFFAKMYTFFLIEVYTKKQKILSLMKFAKFVNEHFSDLLSDPDSEYWINHFAYFCSYNRRNDRLNFCEQVFNFN